MMTDEDYAEAFEAETGRSEHTNTDELGAMLPGWEPWTDDEGEVLP